MADLIQAVELNYGLNPNAEITLEANPGTLDLQKLTDLKTAGVNRLSIGIQSFDNSDLVALGRVHNADQALEAISLSRQAGFDNLSLDFIFGIPGQSLAGWQKNLSMAVEAGVEHLSLYSLILEEGTVYACMVARDELTLPDDDLVADMFELAMDYLAAQGFQQYEISNWSRGAAHQSRHNKVYWQNQDYLGIGAAAHGLLAESRYNNIATTPEYIQRMRQTNKKTQLSPVVEETIPISRKDAMQEHMILGLRMTARGVSASEFNLRYGEELETVFAGQVQKMLALGLLEWMDFEDGRHLRLTRRGIMLGNLVFQEFI